MSFLPVSLVKCLYSEDCVLTCSFKPNEEEVVHWYKQQICVHSYYYQSDQLQLQNGHFSGRTSLFKDQLVHGNASLLLKRVDVSDEGLYKCYTSTLTVNKETFVDVKVEALIQSVRMEMTGEVISCSSQNIYPAPEVAWSTDPLSGPETLQNSTVKSLDSKGLYIVESTVRILGNVSDHAYFCSVISADKAQVWTTSIKKTEELIGEAGRELSIPCIAPQNLQNFSLTWTFTRTNDTTVILIYDSRTRLTSNLWEDLAGLEQDQVLMSKGSLLLHNPESEEQTGTYTCTFTGFQRRHMVQTQVNITARRPTAGVTNVMADHMLWLIPAVSTLLWQSLWNYIH
ncbi:HERV-H LTR-associating protein 2 isoform X2 [Salvelinus sp. IW2-2015]|uniref:HERV-H LTR-associating protein 2 isoform X2 n=1 Tax=Salvelinus sp. IW2-2015 TaxID=2691554 RepID=UPI0038D3A5DA